MNNVSNLQISRGQWHSGLTLENHLSRAFLTEPVMASTLVTRLFNYQTNVASPIDYLTRGMGRTMELTNRQYRWPLMGDAEKSVPIIGRNGDTSTTPGIGRGLFQIVLPERLFESTDNLIFDDRQYKARVMRDPEQVGNGFLYTLQLVNPDPDGFLPVTMLTNGAQVSKEFSTVSEFSDKGGSSYYATPFMLENHLTTLRKEYTVSRSAATDVMVIQMQDPTNPSKKSTMWVNYAEWVHMGQWMREQERMYWYSTFSADAQGVTDIKGQNGLPVYQGAGIREQIAPANKRYYTTLTENIIREFMIDLTYNIAPEGNRKFVAFTGEFGMAEFDKAMRGAAQYFTLVDTKFVTGSGQELTLGGQFTTYKGLNGTEITLKHLPVYDDPIHNRKLHPTTGRPLESYRFTVLDFGINGGESNIVKVYKKDSEFISWHIEGSIGPYGPKKNQSSASSLDGYSVHFLSEAGIMIKNPMACGELICDAA